MRLPAALLLCLAALPARADVAELVEGLILPAAAEFAAATTDLAGIAAADCRPAVVRPAYDAAWEAWLRIADLRIGPGEAAGLTIAFWPDERGNGLRSLTRALAGDGPAINDPEAWASASAAARGLPALDLMLGEPAFAYGPDDPGCVLTATIAADLANQAIALAVAWHDFAPELTEPGAGGHVTYLDAQEVRAALYTQIVTGMTLTVDQRLGRPLGTRDRPRPTRAEAWRTGRALPNIIASAAAALEQAEALAGVELRAARFELQAAQRTARTLTDAGLQDIADPAVRTRVLSLQTSLIALRVAIETGLGDIYGVSVGFNASDGD